MTQRVKTGIEGLLVSDEDMQKYLDIVKADRIVVAVAKIVDLLEGQCSEVGCNGIRKVVERKLEGGVLLLTYKCTKGHSCIFAFLLASKILDH